MKIIVTGATGSLGGALVRHYSNKGHEVIALGRTDSPPENLLKSASSYHQADIRHPFSLSEAEVCIHAAALSDDRGAAKDFYEANVTGTHHVLQAAARCHTFVQISSSAVYTPADTPIPESDAGKAIGGKLSKYGYSKWLAEQEVALFPGHFRKFILRPRGLYGPGDKVILPRMLSRVKHDNLVIPGEMNITVSLTHYANMLHAVDLCLESDLEGIHTFNVADLQPYTLVDVVRKISAAAYHKSLPEKHISIHLIRLLGYLRVAGLSPLMVRTLTRNMVLDTRLIEEKLGYASDFSLDDSLQEIGQWISQIGGPDVLQTRDAALAWA